MLRKAVKIIPANDKAPLLWPANLEHTAIRVVWQVTPPLQRSGNGSLVVTDHGGLTHAEGELSVNVRRSQRLHHLSDLNPDTVAGMHDRPGREPDAIEELPGRIQQLFARAIA